MTEFLVANVGFPWAGLIEAIAAVVVYLVGKQRGIKKGHEEATGASRDFEGV